MRGSSSGARRLALTLTLTQVGAAVALGEALTHRRQRLGRLEAATPPAPPAKNAEAQETGSSQPPRRRLSRRTSVAEDMEWTPEGGGSMQQLRRSNNTLHHTMTDTEQAQHRKKRAWKKRLEDEAARAAAAAGEREEGRDSEDARTTAARMLKQLQAWETRPPGPCDKYNSITSRFLTWQTRRRECNAAPGDCVFMGRSVTGWCIPEEEAVLYDESPSLDDDEEDEEQEGGDDRDAIEYDEEGDFPMSMDPEGPMVETELLQSLVTVIRQEGIEQPVRLLITGSLAEAMTDSLKDGQSGTQELAKELVMEVLTDPETPHALKHLLRNADFRASTRQLLQSLVYLPYTKQEAHRLLKQQLDWLLVKNRTTDQALAATLHTLLKAPYTHDALVPLLTWSFSQDGPIPSLATPVVADKLVPLLEDAVIGGLKVGIQFALENEYVKGLTKDAVKDLLLRVAKMQAAAAAAEAQKRQEEAARREARERHGEHHVEEEEAEAVVVVDEKEKEEAEEAGP